MLKRKGKSKIVVKSKRENISANVKTKVLLAIFIMVASALIVSGSACTTGQSSGPKYKKVLAWQIGDVEKNRCKSPWNEFGNIKAPSYTVNFDVGDSDKCFPKKTGPYCQGRPNKVNIRFTEDLSNGGKFIIRYSPGYTGCEKIKIFLDGERLKTFCDEGGHKNSNYCTYKMVRHSVVIPKQLCGDDDHKITIKHATGDGILWDWLKLKVNELVCEPCSCCNCKCDNPCDNECKDDQDDCDDDDNKCEKKCNKCKKPRECKKPKCNNPVCVKKPVKCNVPKPCYYIKIKCDPNPCYTYKAYKC